MTVAELSTSMNHNEWQAQSEATSRALRVVAHRSELKEQGLPVMGGGHGVKPAPHNLLWPKTLLERPVEKPDLTRVLMLVGWFLAGVYASRFSPASSSNAPVSVAVVALHSALKKAA